MSPPSAAIIPSTAVHLLPKLSYSPPLSPTHHCSSPEPCHPISRRNFAILLSSIVTHPLPSLLQPPPPAYAISFGISGPKEWLREQKKKSAKFLLAPVDASRNILQSAFLLLMKSESEFGGNNWEDVQKLLISAARDCVPQDRNSFVEFQSNTGVQIILGSSSIARKKILSEMGYQFTTMSADIDEKAIRKEKPEDLVMALAEAKADAVASKLQNIENQENDGKPTLLVAADTVVVYQGMIREKPSNKEEARQFIKGYSSGHATTVSSVVVTNLKTGFRRGEWDKVEIQFHDIPEHIIDNLIEEGNVLNVAGGLIIEHPLVLPYVKAVVGTMDSVMGLPKALTERLIKEVL
ncbi:hypothetical protein Fot_19772 [Forsythia ovata]|uniref:Maf-like protein n=1 Tax=Forsythia ovata TaxID=205694 RepID=A0ABD1VM14_9LAMI